MSPARRLAAGDNLTPRQARQRRRMNLRAVYRAAGDLTHGASGVKVRQPIVRNAQPPQRGSFATHVMVAPAAPLPVRLWKRVARA